MKNPLTLEALEVLDTISRKGSYAAAAAVLNRVPSALSYTVQKLEEDLGVTLFQRQGRRSVITSAGQLLVEQGRELLLAADDLAAATRQAATGWEPQLRIAVDHVIPLQTILPSINALYELQPNIEIDISEEVLGGTWEALIEDRVELAIGAVDEVPGHKGIRNEAFTKSQMVFVASPKHPICNEKQPLTNETINQYRSVIVRDTSRNQPPLSRGIHSRNNFIYVPNLRDKIIAHCQGIGVGTLPKHLITKELATKQLIELTTEQKLPITQFHIAWKIANRGQALAWLINHIKQNIKL